MPVANVLYTTIKFIFLKNKVVESYRPNLRQSKAELTIANILGLKDHRTICSAFILYRYYPVGAVSDAEQLDKFRDHHFIVRLDRHCNEIRGPGGDTFSARGHT